MSNDFDLSAAIAAESGNNSEAATPSGSSGETAIPFEANESTEGYALFGNSDKLVEAISTTVFGNDPVYGAIEWEDDISDYQQIVEDNDFNGQQKLDLIHKLMKSTFGEMQGMKNEGYGMGWDTDQSPPMVYDNDEVDHVPYLDVFSELPAFDHTTLTEGEMNQLVSEGLKMDDFGFDRSVEGPQLPVIDGERVPILFEDGDEVEKTLRLINTIDFDEVTYCPKDGELQGTPTLGGTEESDTDKVAVEDSDDDEGDINLAANPEEVGEPTVPEIKDELDRIDSTRTVQTMLRAEKDGKDRTTAIDAIEGRLEELQSETDDDSEEPSESEESEGREATVEKLQKMFDFGSMEVDAMKHRFNSGKADSLQEAAKQVANV